MIPTVCPAYLPNVRYFAWMFAQDSINFVCDTHFQKQTYRNRTEIYGSNGKLKLTIPIIHTKSAHQKENEVLISNATLWQKQHWKSISTAYRSSPYFEYYEKDLEHFFITTETHLFEFNLKIILQLLKLIEYPLNYKIVSYDNDKHKRLDILLNAKTKSIPIQEKYTQVFEQKNGFLPNLSILDLLFNLGPNTSSYLKKTGF